MRRKITLYIDGHRADLKDDSLVLMNYTREALEKPTVVRNSYSQQITLPGTPANNRIFGSPFRTDRIVRYGGSASGPDYNPGEKTPFVIYDERDEVLDSGYVKLDSVTRQGAVPEYKVTLYGGLGSFFYALSYDSAGNKRSLADLQYLHPTTRASLTATWSSGYIQGVGANVGTVVSSSTTSHTDEIDVTALRGATIHYLNYATTSASSTVGMCFFDADHVALEGKAIGAGASARYAYEDTVTVPDNAVTAVFSMYNTWRDQWYAYADIEVAGDPASELDFIINAATVRTAWGTVQDGVIDGIWKVINFAPAYNGIPEGEFSADKAVAFPGVVGLASSVTDGGTTYSTISNYCLVNLAQAQDEWAVKDLRSYLQRPVLSMRAFLEAVCDSGNNGGFEVDMSDIEDIPYNDLWLTLPLIPSLGSFKQIAGDLTLTKIPTVYSETPCRYSIDGLLQSGANVTTSVHFFLRFTLPAAASSYSALYLIGNTASQTRYTRIFIQLVAYDAQDIVVGGSDIVAWGCYGRAASLAATCGYTPKWAGTFREESASYFDNVGNNVFQWQREIGLSCTASNVSYYLVHLSAYDDRVNTSTGVHTVYGGNGLAVFYHDADGTDPLTATYVDLGDGSTADTIAASTTGLLRSNAYITKAMLLSTSRTPAEYLISFAKMFGLAFICDTAAQKVTVVTRNSLFQDETVDLARRVDLSKGVDIRPLAVESKWYTFDPETVEGAWAKEYKQITGRTYGSQKVDTGYDFNADEQPLLDTLAFRNAATVLDRSKYWNYIYSGSQYLPSVWLDKGNTYTLWASDGSSRNTDISVPVYSAVPTYYNDDFPGYDMEAAMKAQFCDKDRKAVDGVDVLLIRNEDVTYPHFSLTDDLPVMDSVNDGKACWILQAGESLTVPVYSRYRIPADTLEVGLSLDFGIPSELDMPGVTYGEGTTIYELAWRKYLSDRFNTDTKVMTCRVDFRGIQVGPELLRKFYWYEGSLWTLNKITNYSLTTYDPVECEFVQVQDKDNYLNGQF